MDATTQDDLLDSLRTSGLELWLEFHAGGMTPRVSDNATPEQLAVLTANREQVMALLLAEARVDAEKHDDPEAVNRDIRWSEPAKWTWLKE